MVQTAIFEVALGFLFAVVQEQRRGEECIQDADQMQRGNCPADQANQPGNIEVRTARRLCRECIPARASWFQLAFEIVYCVGTDLDLAQQFGVSIALMPELIF